MLLSACGKSVAPPTPTSTPLPPASTSTPAPMVEPTQTHLPAVTPVCISPQPAQEDIDRALSYTGQTLALWERTYFVDETRVAVTWQDRGRGALIYLEARIKPCGYEEPDLNKDFNEENWSALFANYESYQPVTACRTDKGLRLYQFTTQNQGLKYAISYWAQSDTDTRVITTMMIFPAAEQAALSAYAARLFPDLPNCS